MWKKINEFTFDSDLKDCSVGILTHSCFGKTFLTHNV